MSLLLVGAGGHARAIAEALSAQGSPVEAYVDSRVVDWVRAQHFESDAEAEGLLPDAFVVGIGGVSPATLSRRLELFHRYAKRGWTARTVVHPAAFVSAHAEVGAGNTILARAVIQPAVRLAEAVIVNTGAIVEHDSRVGAGSHVAPGAIVLGGCTVGACCMIGAGAVILPGATVPDETLVPARRRYPS